MSPSTQALGKQRPFSNRSKTEGPLENIRATNRMWGMYTCASHARPDLWKGALSWWHAAMMRPWSCRMLGRFLMTRMLPSTSLMRRVVVASTFSTSVSRKMPTRRCAHQGRAAPAQQIPSQLLVLRPLDLQLKQAPVQPHSNEVQHPRFGL